MWKFGVVTVLSGFPCLSSPCCFPDWGSLSVTSTMGAWGCKNLCQHQQLQLNPWKQGWSSGPVQILSNLVFSLILWHPHFTGWSKGVSEPVSDYFRTSLLVLQFPQISVGEVDAWTQIFVPNVPLHNTASLVTESEDPSAYHTLHARVGKGTITPTSRESLLADRMGLLFKVCSGHGHLDAFFFFFNIREHPEILLKH